MHIYGNTFENRGDYVDLEKSIQTLVNTIYKIGKEMLEIDSVFLNITRKML